MAETPKTTHHHSSIDYLSKLGSNLLDSVIRKFSNPETARRNRFILLITTALFLTLIILPSKHFSSVNFNAGQIASSDIRAPKDYLIEDRSLSELRRREVSANAPLVYTSSDRIPAYLSGKFEQALTAIREQQAAVTHTTNQKWQALLFPYFDASLNEAEIRALTRIGSSTAFIKDLKKQLDELYQRKIVFDGKTFESDSRRGVEIVNDDGHFMGRGETNTSFTELASARSMLAEWKYAGLGSSADNRKISDLLSRMLLPNFFYNKESSDARAKSSRDTARPVLFKVTKGEMIVRSGERISSEQAQKLHAIFQGERNNNRFTTAIGIFLLILILFHFPYRFACKNIRKFNPSNKDILVLGLLITGSFLLFKIALLVSHTVGSVFPDVQTTNYFYLLPFASGAMIVRIFINSEVSLVYCAALAPLFGIMFNDSMLVMIYSLLGGVVGAHGMRHCTDRSTIYSAGLKISTVNLAMALAFQILNNDIFTLQTVYVGCFALISGIASAILVLGIIPVIEMLFNYTTDIKLLELANLNSPLLRDLMIKAPGTYHHSVVVGNLVEAAAEAINANPLLARVAAYYHDIGKASKPLYFIENQGGEENRHDKLTPSMSALILISHIKEGAELAREKRLGQPIIDIIRQHHGTALIKYFYDRAKTQAEANGHLVQEQDFRYPGPKPQTREAGLVMLADCVEAASRTLINPTPDRIQGLVQNLINRVFTDGQLDECELTLKNLHEIARSFNRILNGIFHHRIEYPEQAYKGNNPAAKKSELKQSVPAMGAHETEGVTTDEHTPGQSPETAPSPLPPVQKSGGEDLKRLGMS